MSSDGLQLFPSCGTTSRSPARDRLRSFTDRWRHRPPTIAEIADVDYLLAVYDVMKQHGGPAPGIDGMSFKDVSRSELAMILRSIVAAIRNGTYIPRLHRQVFIPKANGKRRELNLPNLADRVVGSALNEAVSSYLDQHFHERSMGFRPQRGTWTLFAMLEMDVERSGCTVLTCDDVKNAFPSVNIDLAMNGFRCLLTDPALLRLIEAVMRGAKNNALGISQGCPFSPLALNVLLTFAHDRVMDTFAQNGHDTTPSPLPVWFRYADNLGYSTQTVSEGYQVLNQMNRHVQHYQFQLKGEPGVPVDLQDGTVELLGFQVSLDGNQMRYDLGNKAWQHLDDHLLQAHETDNPPEVANHVITGWMHSLGPVFENRTDDDFFAKIQQTATRHGFREIPSRKHLQHLAQKAGDQWRAYRQDYRERRVVRGTGRVVEAVV